MTQRAILGWTGAMFALATLMPTLAPADVIAIAPDGAIQTYAGPTLFRGETAEGIRASLAAPGGAVTLSAEAPTALPLRAPAHLRPYLQAAAARYRLDLALVDAVAHQESRFRPNAVSPKGAIGVMQLMPGTAAQLGVDPWNVGQNIEGGAAYLRAMLDRFGGDRDLALAAYNAGPGAVEKYRGIPPYRETVTYVQRIRADLAYRASLVAPPRSRSTGETS